jgi:hypothetical protein
MPPRRSQSNGRDVFEAKASFACVYNGGEVSIRKGERVREGHDLLRAYPDKFQPLTIKFDVPEVEQATAAPGEKRGDRS